MPLPTVPSEWPVCDRLVKHQAFSTLQRREASSKRDDHCAEKVTRIRKETQIGAPLGMIHVTATLCGSSTTPSGGEVRFSPWCAP